MSTSRKELIRQTCQMDACARLGLSREEHDILRRASMRLHRWAEMECNHDVQRDEKTNKVTVRYCRSDGMMSKAFATPDRETPALARCQAIADKHGLVFYHQSDPRGVAVYIGKAESLRGHSIESNYSQLLCIY